MSDAGKSDGQEATRAGADWLIIGRCVALGVRARVLFGWLLNRDAD